MSLRLDLDEAERLLAGHLGSLPRAAHSRLVAQIMAELARRLAGERTFLFEMISELSSRLGLDFGVLLGVLGAVCEQDWS